MKIGIYYPTWNSPWVNSANSMDLSTLDELYPGLTDVYLSFCTVDMSYRRGQNSWAGTGMEFSMDFAVVKEAVSRLRSRGVRVLVAIGGASYWGVEKNINSQAIIDLVLDLGLDGVDFDYEVMGDGKGMTRAIGNFTNVLGSVKMYMSAAVWSTGAYPPDGSWRGMARDALNTYGHLLDAINVMSYDAGPPSDYDPIEAFKAYRALYKGDILMGFLVGNPGWGGYLLKEQDVSRNAGYVANNGRSGDGAFLWAHRNNGTPDCRRVISMINSLFKTGIKPPVIVPPIAPPVVAPPITSTPSSNSGFLKTLNAKITLDGKKFCPVGFNAYWLGIMETFNYPNNSQIEEMFIAVKRLGGNTIRSHTLGHSSGNNNSLWNMGITNQKAWDSIDYGYSMARKYGVKIIAPLTDGYYWYNGNYGDFCKFRGVEKDKFWTDNNVRQDFKAYITSYLNHYNPLNGCFIKDDPSLGLIELGNELGNIRPSHGSNTIPTWDWLNDILNHVKSIDKNHLVLCPTDESLGQSGEFNLPFDCYRNHFYWNDYNRINNSSNTSIQVNKPFIVSEIGAFTDEAFLHNIAPIIEGSIFWGMYPHENGINGGNKVLHNDGYTINYSPDNEQVLLKWARHFAKITGSVAPTKLKFGPGDDGVVIQNPNPPVPSNPPIITTMGIKCPVCTTFYQKI